MVLHLTAVKIAFPLGGLRGTSQLTGMQVGSSVWVQVPSACSRPVSAGLSVDWCTWQILLAPPTNPNPGWQS